MIRLVLTLSRQDFITTFRDPVFKALLFFPIFAFILIRWGVPGILTEFPGIGEYRHVVLMWACLQTAVMFGFIYGFVFLEEKEEKVNEVFSVLPVSPLQILLSRLLAGFGISLIINFCLLQYGGILDISLLKTVLLAIQYSIIAPFLAVFIAAFAENRIEGLAKMKLYNIGLYAPALIYILPYKFLHILAIIPTYWSFRSMEPSVSGGRFSLYWAIGMFLYGSVIIILSRRMYR